MLRPRESVVDLYNHILAAPHCPEAEAIRRSVGAYEPDGGQWIKVCKAMLAGYDEFGDVEVTHQTAIPISVFEKPIASEWCSRNPIK